ncbi:MAG: hemerythrin family protein [Gammaproteobacteria bacterium]|nr:hemerythrin family protein [Gammaproteobacteria bacterium]MBU1482268.1 hemerythrin family protein [Gammaproteobacteria bacterium]
MTDSSPWRLEWKDGLSVYIPEIDAEHREFIRLINGLNEAIIGRMDVEIVKKCMHAILDDAIRHFAHEEDLFREWGYPETDEHAIKHIQVVQALNEIMGHFERGGVEYEWIEAGLKVKEALIQHLLKEDMKYRDYYLALRARPDAA